MVEANNTCLPAGGFNCPTPYGGFPLPPMAGLGGLLGARNSLPGITSSSVGMSGLLSPQQFLAKRPSLQEASSEVGH